jgi:hypothetical protein
MAKKVGTPAKVDKKKHFTTPTDTWWGKTLVWLLFIGMVGSVVVAFIFAIIQGNA